MDSTCLVPTVKHGGGAVMVWGCFAGDTVGDLFKIEGTLNQHGYHSILQRHAIPSGLRLVGRSFIFQQDNDPKHTSRLCKGYLTKKESDGVLWQMTWPPQSPDLNPIEMVWGELDRRVKAKGPTSAKHLWELLQDCWKTISEGQSSGQLAKAIAYPERPQSVTAGAAGGMRFVAQRKSETCCILIPTPATNMTAVERWKDPRGSERERAWVSDGSQRRVYAVYRRER
ncbi:hypothetical protein MHYP_G00159470 [Metynnis hypsauchen]